MSISSAGRYSLLFICLLFGAGHILINGLYRTGIVKLFAVRVTKMTFVTYLDP